MHILIFTPVFPPEVRSASLLMFELAETLNSRGHKVTVITSIPLVNTDKRRGLIDRFYKKEEINGIRVIRISAISIHNTRMSAVFRGLGQSVNAFLFFLIGLLLTRVDISLSYSPPLTLGFTGLMLRMIKGIPHILNVQDLVPQYAIDLGILTDKKMIHLIRKVEHFIYQKVQCITVHSNGNRDYIVKEGVEAKKVQIIPNWVDTQVISPMGKENEFRAKHGLEGKFVVLFAGVLGFAQDLDTVVESTPFLREKKDIIFLIVGEGVEKERLVQKARRLGVTNIRFVPFVPKDQYPEVVAASDVCLATLHRSLRCPVVPSKILGYMSGARAVIASLSMDRDAAYLMDEAQGGICVEPGSPKKLAEAICGLYGNKQKCEELGQNGRSFVLKYHSRNNCIDRYENIFQELL